MPKVTNPPKSKPVTCEVCGGVFPARGIASHRRKCAKKDEVDAQNELASAALAELERKRKRGKCRYFRFIGAFNDHDVLM